MELPMRFTELQVTLRKFDLDDRATLKQIKKRNCELVKEHHLDAGLT